MPLKAKIACEEALVAQRTTQFRNLALGFVDSMLIRCAIELNIPDIVHNHGQPISLSDLSTTLAIPPAKRDALRRLMRALSHIGCFEVTKNASVDAEKEEEIYSLTTFSGLLVKGDHDHSTTSLAPYILMSTHPLLMSRFHSLGSWLLEENLSTTAFEMANGMSVWDMLGTNTEMNKLFNDAMAVNSMSVMDVVVNKCAKVFEGLTSLVDVGGGTGASARAIAREFPEIRCTVLDLPHVVDAAMDRDLVEFVAGDMFSYIPPANALLLKWLLHDWNDEDCIKILQRCKAAIPSKEKGGKVIIIEMVLDPNHPQQQASKAQIKMDMLIMGFNGKEREEHEWRDIFDKAGFSSYDISPATDTQSIIELYP